MSPRDSNLAIPSRLGLKAVMPIMQCTPNSMPRSGPTRPGPVLSADVSVELQRSIQAPPVSDAGTRWRGYLFTDHRSYPRNLAMILYHLLFEDRNCSSH